MESPDEPDHGPGCGPLWKRPTGRDWLIFPPSVVTPPAHLQVDQSGDRDPEVVGQCLQRGTRPPAESLDHPQHVVRMPIFPLYRGRQSGQVESLAVGQNVQVAPLSVLDAIAAT